MYAPSAYFDNFVFRQKVMWEGKIMIYFDHAATGGWKPEGVKEAVKASLCCCANPGRSGHALSLGCLERVYSCRKLLSEFFGGYGYERTIFTKNCTEALNIALFGLFSSGDKIVSTVAEHNSVLRPLQRLEEQGVIVHLAPLTSSGDIDLADLIAHVHTDTKAVVITLASNVTGTAPDIERIRHSIPPQTLLICDGAQACGHVAVNMKKSGIDVLCVAGHKGLFAMQGSGALLLSERVNPRPLMFGGTGSESNNLHMPEFLPDRLEAGTLNYPAIVSLAEGTLYAKAHFHENRDKILHLMRVLHEGLQKIEGVKLFSRVNPFGIAAFAIDGISSETVAYRLSEEYAICVRGGLHCAPLMHEALHSEGLVRLSLAASNSLKEAEIFLGAVKTLASSR
jgi:selenocysteine lyase/cysteine desulfurase